MRIKLLLTFALLLTAVTGAWANEYLYFEVSGTSATMKYGEIILGKPYYDERADWWISNNSPWDGRENIKTITVDASCQNFNQENLSELFYEFTNLKTITNIDKLNTANVLDMSRLFQGCSSLSTLDLSGWNTSEVTDMSSMFYGCTSLTTLNIIGWDTSKVTNTVSMFSGCTKLASISFPASLTTIGDDAFQGCTDLATVTVYAPSCTLGSNAFNGCGKLSNIYVFSDRVNYYQNATNWKDYAEIITGIIGGYCGTTDHEKDVVWVLTGESTNYTLTITGTGAMADYPDPSERPWDSYATEIETVIIEDGVTSIGAYAFQSCTSLSSITLAEGLTTIGGYAFYNCGTTITTIESVTIPESVTSIGGNAFNGTNVTNFYINNIPSKIAIGETPFKADGVTIHVFTQMQSTFENATNWSAYTGHFNADIAISHVQSITLDNESMIMKTNTSGKLNATINPADARVKDVVFTSSNDNIIHITNAATGEFEAGSTEGNATITCTAMDGSGKYSSCTVTVWKSFTPAESVTLNMSSMSVNVGNTFRLTATINPTNATYKDVTWRSSDENVATVDNNGYVTAIALGVATITAISHDGQARANCVVTVVASGSCGTGVTWTLTGTSPNYTLTITGTGAMADYAFSSNQPWYSYATEIETLVIENGVTRIGVYAFCGCTGLTSIEIPASVGSIGVGAFIDCSNIVTMTVDGDNAVYDSRDNCNAIIEKSSNTLIVGCKNTTIPDDVTSIGYGAFYGCTDLTSIEIPASVGSIGDFAFAGTGLTSIEIPASVTSIGDNAFRGCSELATVTVYTPSCTLGVDAFDYCGKLANIYVLSDKVSQYKTTWSAYVSKIAVMFDGTSTTTVNFDNDVTVNGVLYNRTFTASKPSTVMLPFSLGEGQKLTGGKLYKFTGVTKNETTGKWEATMTETATLQANTPYLLLPDENLVDGKVTFNLNNSTVTLNTNGGGNRVTADQGSHWTFKGTYEYMKWTTDTSDPDYNAERKAEIGRAYGFAGVAKDGINVGDFVKVASGAKIRPMGCYLLWSDTPNASRAAARGAATEELPQSITVRLVSADGEVTGIGEIDTKTGEMTFDSEAWYTLNGVRLSGKPTKKGLYINNGKKVVIK